MKPISVTGRVPTYDENDSPLIQMKDVSEIDSQMQRLEAAGERLVAAVRQLEARLSPVTRPVPVAADSPDPSSVPDDLSSLGQAISANVIVFQGATDRIRDAIVRLAI